MRPFRAGRRRWDPNVEPGPLRSPDLRPPGSHYLSVPRPPRLWNGVTTAYLKGCCEDSEERQTFFMLRWQDTVESVPCETAQKRTFG